MATTLCICIVSRMFRSVGEAVHDNAEVVGRNIVFEFLFAWFLGSECD